MFESYTASAERTLIGPIGWRDGGARRAVEPLDLLAALAAESESRATNC